MTDVKVEIKGQVGLISLSSNDRLNRINAATLNDISESVVKLDRDDKVKVIVIRGGEKAFSSGLSATEFVKTVNMSMLEDMSENFAKIADARKPVIAEVSGYAIGIGFEIALACDMIFCSDNAWFSVPDLSMGTVPGFGSTQRLPKAVGKAKAMEMILSGRAVGAQEAERVGLVSRIIPLMYLHDETMKAADIIASQPPVAISTAKELIKTAVGNTDLEEGLEIEKQVYKSSLESDEYRANLE
ncbi:MAG: enoyl-CoA hydratase/isomerase family protein, partial [Alphaproteobacteria bacterium]|nr:enoyl-CoA hydratase/isomerase family protein [Alphaproteobacteria bacterium]